MEHGQMLEGVRAEIDAMAKATASADMSLPVPGCPDWDLAELLRHTGRVHRWVTGFVAERATEFPGWSKGVTDVPEDAAGLSDWLAAGAEPLLAQLSGDPATEVWSFAPGGSIGWWRRRMLQETTVHRADAELALGLDPAIEAAVAIDGVEELLGVLLPPRGGGDRARGLDRVGDSIHLHATDAPGEWTIVLTEGGFEYSAAHTKATAAVRGSASDLLLLLWNRRSVRDEHRFEVFGDADLVGGFTGVVGF
ncbi:MAG: maleylpyruvate isomerase family mycothiol-dependent enzyme [Sporichthyaceae bacterium]